MRRVTGGTPFRLVGTIVLGMVVMGVVGLVGAAASVSAERGEQPGRVLPVVVDVVDPCPRERCVPPVVVPSVTPEPCPRERCATPGPVVTVTPDPCPRDRCVAAPVPTATPDPCPRGVGCLPDEG